MKQNVSKFCDFLEKWADRDSRLDRTPARFKDRLAEAEDDDVKKRLAHKKVSKIDARKKTQEQAGAGDPG